jgi:hypothetical protein
VKLLQKWPPNTGCLDFDGILTDLEISTAHRVKAATEGLVCLQDAWGFDRVKARVAVPPAAQKFS